jgi:hypothetical protein
MQMHGAYIFYDTEGYKEQEECNKPDSPFLMLAFSMRTMLDFLHIII